LIILRLSFNAVKGDSTNGSRVTGSPNG
jgi:hypothetical protein